MEFQFGNTTYYTIYDVVLVSFELYIISNENQAPTLIRNNELPTILVKGSEAPDLSKYFSYFDVEDKDLQIVTEGTVDMTQKGVYPVKFTVTDSEGLKAEATIQFEVLNEADTIAPEIKWESPDAEEMPALPEQLDVDAYATDTVKNFFMQGLKITDQKDGETIQMAVTAASINWGALDMTKAGKYKIVVTIKDDSGNEGKFEHTLKVVKPGAQGGSWLEVGDYMTQSFNAESVTAEVKDGVLEIVPTGEVGGWGSANKAKMELLSPFEVGQTYKLVVEAKADVARTICLSFASAEGSWSKYGSVGKIDAALETEWEKFEVEFTYTGKFEKDGVEYDVAYTALEIQLGHLTWGASESLDNKVYIRKIQLLAKNEGELIADYMTQSFTQEKVEAEVKDGVLEIIPTTEVGGWGSANKAKMELLVPFEVDKSYKLVVEAKADVARTICLSFACAEAGWAKYGSVGKIDAALGTDWEEFEVEFTYTGKFEKDGVEYAIVYTALEIQLGHLTWGDSETLDNKVYIRKINLYELPATEELIADYMTQSFTQEKVEAEVKDGVLEIIPTTEVGGWGSANKAKMELLVPFEVDKSYKLVVEAKADVARTICLSFACAEAGWAKYGSVGKIDAALGTDWEEFEVEFTYTGKFEKDGTEYAIVYTALEIQLGHLTWGASESLDNKVYIRKIDLYELFDGIQQKPEEPEEPETPEEPEAEPVLLIDFEDGAGSGAYNNAKWAQEKYTNEGWVAMSSSQMNSRSKVTKVANIKGFNSITTRYTYSDGESLGFADSMSFELGNYYSGVAIDMKLILIAKDDSLVYLKGTADSWFNVAVGENLELIELDFDRVEVKGIRFVIGNATKEVYLYLDNIKLFDSQAAEQPETPETPEEPETPAEPAKANLLLDFEDGAGSDKYVNAKWTQEKYQDNAWVATSDQMNSRSKNGSKVANVVGATVPTKYTYADGASLGLANKLSIDMGNYWDPKLPIEMKLAVVTKAGAAVYLLGSETEWNTVPVGEALVKSELTFDEVEVVAIVIALNAGSGNYYLYLDNIKLEYVEAAETPETPEEPEPEVDVEYEIALTNAISSLNVIGVKLSKDGATKDVAGVLDGLKIKVSAPEGFTSAIIAVLTPGSTAVAEDQSNVVALSQALAITEHAASWNNAIAYSGATMLKLDFENATSGAAYDSALWKREQYKTDWEAMSGQMNCRTKDGTKVVNCVAGGYTTRYTFESQIGKVDYFSIKLGNYFDNAKAISAKIALIKADGSMLYLFGDANNFESIPVTTDLITYEKEFAETEVKGVRIVLKNVSGNAYLYMDDITLKTKNSVQMKYAATIQEKEVAIELNAGNTNGFLKAPELGLEVAVSVVMGQDGSVTTKDIATNGALITCVGSINGTFTVVHIDTVSGSYQYGAALANQDYTLVRE